MLVITRRPNEAIVVEPEEGKSIELVVLGIRGRQVRIGIKAPPEIAVQRKETYERQQLEEVQEQADLQETPLSASE